MLGAREEPPMSEAMMAKFKAAYLACVPRSGG
jgi:hypothetical protein